LRVSVPPFFLHDPVLKRIQFPPGELRLLGLLGRPLRVLCRCRLKSRQGEPHREDKRRASDACSCGSSLSNAWGNGGITSVRFFSPKDCDNIVQDIAVVRPGSGPTVRTQREGIGPGRWGRCGPTRENGTNRSRPGLTEAGFQGGVGWGFRLSLFRISGRITHTVHAVHAVPFSAPWSFFLSPAGLGFLLEPLVRAVRLLIEANLFVGRSPDYLPRCDTADCEYPYGAHQHSVHDGQPV
jgi:hypothetical protein